MSIDRRVLAWIWVGFTGFVAAREALSPVELPTHTGLDVAERRCVWKSFGSVQSVDLEAVAPDMATLLTCESKYELTGVTLWVHEGSVTKLSAAPDAACLQGAIDRHGAALVALLDGAGAEGRSMVCGLEVPLQTAKR
jgi:hypothetical protein